MIDPRQVIGVARLRRWSRAILAWREIAVSKHHRLTVGLAVVGLAITVVLFVYGEFRDYSRPPNRLDDVFVILGVIFCPPSLLQLLCIDCEAGTSAGVFMWSVIGLINVALYVGIGLVIERFRGRSDRTTPRLE